MKVRAFITHKKAEHFQDCQDRFSVNYNTKSVAVSDGMSQSIFQKIWAEILVDAYTKSREWIPSNEPDHSTVKTNLSYSWELRVKERLNEMRKEGRNTTRTENSLALGGSAGATIVGVRFDGNKWHGDVLGDSCLIEVQDSKIVRFLTSQDGDGFDNHPDYYDSNPNQKGKGVPKAIEGELSTGMSMLLVSDPFSDFFMEQKKNGTESKFLEEVLSVRSHDDFEALVSKWRAEYGMHNDDSTLLIIEHDGSDELNILSEDNIEKLIEGDAVAAPKAPANPFHRNSPQPNETSQTVEMPEVVSENTNVSQSSDENGGKVDNQHQESTSSTHVKNEAESMASPVESISPSEPMAPADHSEMQNWEDEKPSLQKDLVDARKSCEQAQKDAREWEDKCKELSAEKLRIEKERDFYRAEKETLAATKAQFEEVLKKEAARKEELDQLKADFAAKLEAATTLNQNLEKEKKQLKDQVESIQNKMQVSNVAHETEISRKNQTITDLKEQLRIAQSPRVAEHSEVLSFCLEQYDVFWKTQPIYKRYSLFDQRDEMREIVTRLLDSYIIIKH